MDHVDLFNLQMMLRVLMQECHRSDNNIKLYQHCSSGRLFAYGSMHPSITKKTKFFHKFDCQHTCMPFSMYKGKEKARAYENEEIPPCLAQNFPINSTCLEMLNLFDTKPKH